MMGHLEIRGANAAHTKRPALKLAAICLDGWLLMGCLGNTVWGWGSEKDNSSLSTRSSTGCQIRFQRLGVPTFFFWQKNWVRTIRTKNSIPYVNCDICCHFTGLGLQGESAEAIPAKWGISAGLKETRVLSSVLPVAHRPRAGHPRLRFPPLPISEYLSSKTVSPCLCTHLSATMANDFLTVENRYFLELEQINTSLTDGLCSGHYPGVESFQGKRITRQSLSLWVKDARAV